MVVIAKRAGATALHALTMKPGKTVVALDSVRDRPRRRRPHSIAAYASEELVLRRHVILDASGVHDIVKERLPVSFAMLRTVPG